VYINDVKYFIWQAAFGKNALATFFDAVEMHNRLSRTQKVDRIVETF